MAATLSGAETQLTLPALPIVVKTSALPLVVCPPPAGTAGAWELELGDGEAAAIYRTQNGAKVGFALAGGKPRLQQQIAKRMPPLLPSDVGRLEAGLGKSDSSPSNASYECETCGYFYDPEEGDPDGGIPPVRAGEASPTTGSTRCAGLGRRISKKWPEDSATVRRSAGPKIPGGQWSWRQESNPRPADYKSAALPTELRQREETAPAKSDSRRDSSSLQVSQTKPSA